MADTVGVRSAVVWCQPCTGESVDHRMETTDSKGDVIDLEVHGWVADLPKLIGLV